VGAPGPRGAAGPAGPRGLGGATWLAGTGPPSPGLGRGDDLYLATRSGDVFRKSEDRWQKRTNLRSAAAGPGAAWYTSAGPPDDSVGRDGDLHLDLSSDVISRRSFGWKRVPGTRADSSRWTVGNRFPQSEDGREGEYFLDLTRGTIHQKRDGLWRELERVEAGPGGWDWGRGAPKEDAGAPDDVYLDTATGRIYRKVHAWRPFARLGAAPEPEPSPAGTSFRLGSGAPEPSSGASGDLYLDTHAGRLYQRRDSGWRTAYSFAAANAEPTAPGPDRSSGEPSAPGPDRSSGEPSAPGP